MKITVLICLLFAVYQTATGKTIQANTSKLEVEEELCINELHLNKTEIEIIKNLHTVPEDDANLNQFLSCYWKKMDWVNEDGTIKYENIQEGWTNQALDQDERESENNPIKLMVQRVLQTSILECQNKLSVITIAKFQNCMIREIEHLLG